jgi:phage terminase large subunit-like protein
MPPKEQAALLKSLSKKERDAINWWLIEDARDKQIPPEGDWFCWLLRSGRGFGKTRTGAEYIIHRARSGYRRIALIGQTKGDVRDTMIEAGDSSILQVAPPNFKPIYEPSKRRLVFPNGCMAFVYSGDEPDQLRGPQHDTAWVDELAKFKYYQETWDNLEFGLRISVDPRVVVTTTPRPIKIIKDLVNDPDTIDVMGTSYENEDNLSASFKRRVIKKYEGTRLGRQELRGELLEDTPGALWTLTVIDACRVTTLPGLFRIGVGVDPHATTGETGIIVAGIGYVDGELHGYILEDLTTGGKPDHWAGASVAAYNKWSADILVGEINNGGDMIETTIRGVEGGKRVNYKTVRATKGKYTRAEPVSVLYGNPDPNSYKAPVIHHVGTFPALEDQMCTYVPGDQPSPNNMDAAVWILTELMGITSSDTGFADLAREANEQNAKKQVEKPEVGHDFDEV